MTPSDREKRLLDVGRRVVETSGADETEVLLSEGREFLTRFSRNRLHQNVGTEEVWAIVRLVAGKRVGVATTSSLAAEALETAVASALAIAEASEPDKTWPGLPKPRPVKAVEAYDAETAQASADARADFAAEIIAAARKKRAEAAGIVETAESSLAIVSSAGVAVASSRTRAEANTVVTCGDGSGYAEGLGTCLSALRGHRIGQRAALTASISRKPRPLDAGRYDVVLEPAAVGEWLQYLAYVALSGKDFEEGSSPLSGRLGEKVTGEQVTIWDNALDRRTIPQAFDYEGMPKKRLSLIDRGVAKGVGTNHYRARHLGKRISTGSALPASSSAECLPLHLFMKGGTSSARRLVAEMKRGLVITRFHYTNILDPMKTVLTGMTRDGTFLVEDGRIVHPVRNLRYTENVLEALGRIDGMTQKLTLVAGPCVVPTVRIKGVQFTGTTEF